METEDPEAGFGYIVPYWVSEPYPIIEEYHDKTCILLPLKAEKRDYVEDQLKHIAPETILFLRKLKSLKIEVNNEIIEEVVRDDQEKPIIHLHGTAGEASYWLIEERVEVPVGMDEVKREGIKNRAISIAFPLSSSIELGDTILSLIHI